MHKTAAPWEELREKYEAGGYTYMQLAKEYGVSVQTVGRHARKENWVSGCRNERRRRAESRDCLLFSGCGYERWFQRRDFSGAVFSGRFRRYVCFLYHLYG